jgi:uncharacterized protein (TIGR04255 family)
MADYLYEKPPLVEVIADLQWEITPVRSIPVPNSGVDPFFSQTTNALKAHPLLAEYAHHESLTPPDVPLEFFAYQPLVRFRKAANTWPLYQLGPGLWSTNITPPYQGWAEFRPILRNGLKALSECYPAYAQTLRLRRAELRYLDAFPLANTQTGYAEFVKKALLLNATLPAPIVQCAGHPTAVAFQGEFSFPIGTTANLSGGIKLSPGAVKGQRSAILELAARSAGSPQSMDPDELLACFDELHYYVRSWFEDLITDDLRVTFGSRREIQGNRTFMS